MAKKLFLLVVVSILFGLLGACSAEENQGTKNNENTEKDGIKNESNGSSSQEGSGKQWKDLLSVPEIPKTIEEIANQPSGKLSDFHIAASNKNKEEELKKALDVFDKLPKLEKGTSKKKKDAYWRKLVALFHEDYPSPSKIIKELKISRFGNPDIKDDRFQFKQNLNVEVILDASGSMAGMVDGKTKMEAAKEAIQSFASSLPDDAKVGLRIYGHKGSGSESDKKLSCNSSKLVYKLQNYNAANFEKSLNRFKPAGWTPIALALNKAKEDLSQYPGEKNTNIIYLVSDGVATCGGDPVTAAKNLADSKINPIVNVIGFDVDSEGQKQLKKISKKLDGIFSTIQNKKQLKQQLEKAQSIADKWREWKTHAGNKASIQHNEQNFDILGFTVEWAKKKNEEYYNIDSVLRGLRKNGNITEKAFDYFSSKLSERDERIKKYTSELEERLEKINNKNFKEAKEQIKEKYNKNTDN